MVQRSLVTEEDVITSGEALFMFRDLRQEVTVLAQLDHPYIVALLGQSLSHFKKSCGITLDLRKSFSTKILPHF